MLKNVITRKSQGHYLENAVQDAMEGEGGAKRLIQHLQLSKSELMSRLEL